MMTPIEILIQEHEAVRQTLRILEKIAESTEKTGSIPDPADVEQLIEFFRVFVDRCHHGKEEDFLFPALEKIGVNREGGPIGVMLVEHQKGRGHVAAIGEALKRYGQGDRSAAQAIVEHARQYIAMLNQHIIKENQVLYPLAEEHLSAATLSGLSKQFDTVEAERIGPGRHEAFHEMLDELGRKYLGG